MSSIARPVAVRWISLLALTIGGWFCAMVQILNIFPGSSAVMPNLLLIYVYYWAVHQPQAIPSWLVVLLGLYYDLLLGLPLGLNALPLLLVWFGMAIQRRVVMREAFLVRWVIVSMVVTLYYVVVSFAVTLCSSCGQANGLWLLQMLTTALVYPFMHAFCGVLLYRLGKL